MNAAQVPGPRKGIGVSHREVPYRVVRARRHRDGDHSPERHHALLADRLVDHSEGLLPDFTIRHQMSRFSFLEPLRCLGLRSPLRSTRRGRVLEPYPARTLVLQKRGRGGTIRSLQSARVRVDFNSLGKINNVRMVHFPLGSCTPFMGSPTPQALPFLYFASGQQRRRQEVLSDGGQALVPRVVGQSVAASVQPAIPTRSMAIGRRKTVPARKAMGVIRKPMSASKMKGKRSTRKDRGRR